MVQTTVSKECEAYRKIEIRQIGKHYQYSKTQKILAPLRGHANLQLLRKDEESPESGKAVCDWRSHRRSVSASGRSGRGQLSLPAGGLWRLQKPVVNALDLRANMPPVEVGQNGGSRVGAQLGCEGSFI